MAPSPASALRRRLYTAALGAFRRLPAPARRTLVRAGTPGFTVGAVCVLDHEGAVLFLRQPHRTGWSLPGGLLDRGEDPTAAVEREVREETGLWVRVGVPVATQVNAQVRRVDVIFRITVAERPEVVPGGEAQAAAWLRPEEVGDDADAPTHEILALLARAVRPGGHDGAVVPPA